MFVNNWPTGHPQAEDGLVSVDLELIEAALALLVDLVTHQGGPAAARTQLVTACMQAGVVRVLFELHQLGNRDIDRCVRRGINAAC